MKKKYNHKKGKLAEAIGFEEEEYKKIIDDFNSILEQKEKKIPQGGRPSEVTEVFEKFAQKSPENLRFICNILEQYITINNIMRGIT